MTANLSNKALNKLYESGSRKFINIDHRIGLPDLVEDIKLNKKYQFTRSQNSEWNTERKSHLIESLLVNVPIIPIVLYESNYGEYDVIDGNQRIRAIVDFYKNKFELTGVKFLPELNGYNYQRLPSEVKHDLDKRRLFVTIVIQGENSQFTDEQAKQLIRSRYEV